MSRRKIKRGGHQKKLRGRRATAAAEAHNRRQPIRALESMRRHNKMQKEFEEAKRLEAEAEKERVAALKAEKETACHMCNKTTEYYCAICELPVCEDCTVPITAQNQITETRCNECQKVSRR